MKLEHIKTKAGWTEDSVDLDSTRVIEEHELLGPEDKIDSRDVAPDRKIWEHPLVRLGAAFGVMGFAVMLFFTLHFGRWKPRPLGRGGNPGCGFSRL